MDQPFVSGTRSYSDAERERDKADSSEATKLQTARRKATPSKQRYNTQGTPGHHRATNRMVGSE